MARVNLVSTEMTSRGHGRDRRGGTVTNGARSKGGVVMRAGHGFIGGKGRGVAKRVSVSGLTDITQFLTFSTLLNSKQTQKPTSVTQMCICIASSQGLSIPQQDKNIQLGTKVSGTYRPAAGHAIAPFLVSQIVTPVDQYLRRLRDAMPCHAMQRALLESGSFGQRGPD